MVGYRYRSDVLQVDNRSKRINTAMTRSVFLEAISALIVALFVYTALSKLLDPITFMGQMHNQPLPRWLTDILIWFIPSSELIAAALLLIRPLRRYGLLLSSFLLLVFTMYVGLVYLHFFDRTPCSCGGVFRHMSWGEHLTFNFIFTVLAFIGVCLQRNALSINARNILKYCRDTPG